MSIQLRKSAARLVREAAPVERRPRPAPAFDLRAIGLACEPAPSPPALGSLKEQASAGRTGRERVMA